MKLKPMNWFIRWVCPKWVTGITLPPFGIYFRHGEAQDTHLIAHEVIHWQQYERMGLLRYYVTYLWYSLKYGYLKNPMEIEARHLSTGSHV